MCGLCSCESIPAGTASLGTTSLLLAVQVSAESRALSSRALELDEAERRLETEQRRVAALHAEAQEGEIGQTEPPFDALNVACHQKW